MKAFLVTVWALLLGIFISLVLNIAIGFEDPYLVKGISRNSYPVVNYSVGILGNNSLLDKYNEALNLIESENLDYLEKLLIIVDISEQREYIFDQEGNLIEVYRISTGSNSIVLDDDVLVNRAMDESVWRVSQKIGYELSPVYGPRLMFLERYLDEDWVKTEVALHGTNLPEIIGKPESLGCVYHKNADIIDLYEIVDIGTFVVAID